MYFIGLNKNEVTESRVEMDGSLAIGESLGNITTEMLMGNITHISSKTGKLSQFFNILRFKQNVQTETINDISRYISTLVKQRIFCRIIFL